MKKDYITIQSMTTTQTTDIEATVAQIKRLETLGCDIIRVAVPDIASANAITEIKNRINIPLVADIHFDHKLALRAADAGADKIRINPGNIGKHENVKAVAEKCRQKNIPIRIGVNSGSLSKAILKKHGSVTAEAMLESALEHIELLNRYDFDEIWLSAKTSSVPLTVAVYKLLHEHTKYPLHLGITEAGTEYTGIIKSAMGIGALLLEGIGDTIRVSLTAPPEAEIKAAKTILTTLGLRPGIDIISCPTCGRCSLDLIKLVNEVEDRINMNINREGSPHRRFSESVTLAETGTENRRCGSPKKGLCSEEKSSPKKGLCSYKNLTIAIMGCAVNGPGEASQADYGIAGNTGSPEGIIFAKGKVIKKAPVENLVKELFEIMETK